MPAASDVARQTVYESNSCSPADPHPIAAHATRSGLQVRSVQSAQSLHQLTNDFGSDVSEHAPTTTPGTSPPASVRRRRWWPRRGRWPSRAGPPADRRPVRRAAGPRRRRRLLHPAGQRRAHRRPTSVATRTMGMQPHGRQHGRADHVLRRLLRRRDGRGHHAGRDPGLGAGLPRLPAAVAGRDTVVFEIDQPEVIEFKTRTLAELGAAPTARSPHRRRRPARRLARRAAEAGFDPSMPTAWSAEGLLGYLPPDAQDRLLDHDHRAQRAGQPLRHRERADRRPADQERRCASGCRQSPTSGASTASTSTSPSWSTSATATRRPTYLPATAGRSTRRHRSGICSPRTACRRSTTRTMAGSPTSLRQRGTRGRRAMSRIRRRQLGPGIERRRDRDDGRRGAGAGLREPNPLIDDPYAAPLVRAVGIDFFTKLVDGERLDLTTAPTTAGVARLMTDVMAVRTRFFDDFFLDAARRRRAAGGDPGLRAGLAGLPAAVAGGHGRLRDRPAPGHRGKTATMAEHRRRPRPPTARTVAVDLRDDWPPALRAAASTPTAADRVERRGPAGVSAAGGPGPAVRRHHRAVSAPGSRLATEYHPDGGASIGERAKAHAATRGATTVSTSTCADLFYDGRTHARRRLSDGARAGRCTPATRPDVFAAYGRDLPATPKPLQPTAQFTVRHRHH